MTILNGGHGLPLFIKQKSLFVVEELLSIKKGGQLLWSLSSGCELREDFDFVSDDADASFIG